MILYLDKGCHGQVCTARLLRQLFVLPEDVFRHRLHQRLHTAQVGRGEALRPQHLQEHTDVLASSCTEA